MAEDGGVQLGSEVISGDEERHICERRARHVG